MMSSAAITNRLTRLEDKGLLARRTDPSNRRNVVALTTDGRTLVDHVVEGHLENEWRLLAPLTAQEQADLAALLERFLAGSGDTSRAAGATPT